MNEQVGKTSRLDNPNNCIYIYRQTPHYFLPWFGRRLDCSMKQDPCEYKFYKGLMLPAEKRKNGIKCENNTAGQITFNKFDFLFLKHLILQYAKAQPYQVNTRSKLMITINYEELLMLTFDNSIIEKRKFVKDQANGSIKARNTRKDLELKKAIMKISSMNNLSVVDRNMGRKNAIKDISDKFRGDGTPEDIISEYQKWYSKVIGEVRRNTFHSLSKFSEIAFQFGKTYYRLILGDRTAWMEDQARLDIQLNREAFNYIIPLSGFETTPQSEYRKTKYPLEGVLNLYRKVKTVNTFLIIDRILTLPLRFNDEDRLHFTRFATVEYLSAGRGRETSLIAAFNLLKSEGLIKEYTQKPRKDITEPIQYRFFMNY